MLQGRISKKIQVYCTYTSSSVLTGEAHFDPLAVRDLERPGAVGGHGVVAGEAGTRHNSPETARRGQAIALNKYS